MKNITLIITLVAVSILSVFIFKGGLWIYQSKRYIQQRKNLVLEETDHKELLVACQNILENHTYYYEFDDPNWPPVIKKLEPSYVRTDNNEPNQLHIEMGGGFFSFGIVVCEDKPDWYIFELQKLSDGLWYYEEE